MRYSQTITIVITLRSNKILPSSLTVSTNAASGAVSFGKVNTFIPLKEKMLKKYFRFLHFYTAGRQGGWLPRLPIHYYIYRQTDGHRKKVGLDVQTGDTSSMTVEQHQPRKAADPKNEGPLPTLLQATAATPGLVVVTSATAIRIL